jgi:hypothetical protein
LEEATLIGDAARSILTEHGHDPSVVAQIGDMVMHATEQAIRRLRGAAPPAAMPLDQGGKYKFVGPVDDSPPADVDNVGLNVEPKDPAVEVKHEPEPERNNDGSVRWLF